MNTDALVSQLRRPVAIQLCTVGPDLRPQSVRGFGVDYEAKPGVLSLVVLDAQSADFRGALVSSRRLAVNLGDPVTFDGIQLKGPLVALEEPSPPAAQVAARYFEIFCATLTSIGFERDNMQGFFHRGPARWVRFRPEEIFDQTPGPGAGKKL